MTTQVMRFMKLSDPARRQARELGYLMPGDQVEVLIRRRGAAEHIHALPAEAVAAVGALLGHLCDGDGVAVLAQTQALSPNDAARVLGISRPLVVHRMAVGDLPFRYVGQHRRATLKDVLALKAKLETESDALSALAEDSDELHQLYGV